MQKTTYDIKHYLGEREEEFSSFLLNDKRVLSIAPCGSGKTFTTINILKKSNQKFIFAVPNVTVKEQLEKEYNLKGTSLYSLSKLMEQNANFIVCCYESLSRIKDTKKFNDYTLVYDEYHSLIGDFHYRDNTKILNILNDFKSVKFLTATPNNLINNFDEVVEFETTKRIKADVFLISQIEKEKLTKTKYKNLLDKIQEIKPFPTLLVISNGKDDLEQITGDKIIYSDNRKGDKYNSLIKGFLSPGLTVSTNLFNAGLSLYNETEVNLIIDFKGYDISKANYIQLINRFRKAKKVNVFVINRGIGDWKAKNSSIKEWLDSIIERLNNGTTNLFKEKVFNQAFLNCITFDSIEKKFKPNLEYLPLVEQLINGAKNSTREIIKEVCKSEKWDFVNELKLGEIQEETFEKIRKGKTSKSLLKDFFIEENEILEFAFQYLKYRVLKNDVNEQYLISNFKDEYYNLKTALSQDKKLIDTLEKRLISKITKENYFEDIKTTLNNYFKLESKFNCLELAPGTIELLKESILKLETDNHRYSKARLKIAEIEPSFNPKRTITNDKTVKEFIKFLGIKPTRKINQVFYEK